MQLLQALGLLCLGLTAGYAISLGVLRLPRKNRDNLRAYLFVVACFSCLLPQQLGLVSIIAFMAVFMSSPGRDLRTAKLNDDWLLTYSFANPAETLKVFRPDGRFFEIVFNPKNWGQPVLVEKRDPDGYGGRVTPIVKFDGSQWLVLTVRVKRPCDDFATEQVESVRVSASNKSPYLAETNTTALTELSGFGYANSARMSDRILSGVYDVTQTGYALPEGADWMSFSEFSRCSTDSLTKSALFQFITEILQAKLEQRK